MLGGRDPRFRSDYPDAGMGAVLMMTSGNYDMLELINSDANIRVRSELIFDLRSQNDSSHT